MRFSLLGILCFSFAGCTTNDPTVDGVAGQGGSAGLSTFFGNAGARPNSQGGAPDGPEHRPKGSGGDQSEPQPFGSSGAGGSSGSTADHAGEGGTGSTSNGGAGGNQDKQTGNGGIAGNAGSSGDPICPVEACCIGDNEYGAGAVDPTNVCQICAPEQSTRTWSARPDTECGGRSTLQPTSAIDKFTACGPSGCSPLESPSGPETSLIRVGSVPNTNVRRLLLDFSHISPNASVSVHSAKLSVFLKILSDSASVKLNVEASGIAKPLCTLELTSKEFESKECDITAAMTAWLEASANDARTITLALTQLGTRAAVLTPSADDQSLRPNVVVDYTATCENRDCPHL